MTFEIKSFILLVKNETISAELYQPPKAKAVYVFAHGAGTDMHHKFMKDLATELASLQIATLRYNFLYTEQKKKRPDFPAVAHVAVAAAITKAHELFPKLPLIAGGKSFGGRMTSQYISANPLPFVNGLAFVGFPLHPAGKPAIDRAEHLAAIKIPMLFLQGTKDALASWDLITRVCSKYPHATLAAFEGADHSFKAGKKNLIPEIAAKLNDWMDAQRS
ncbi:MAG TPA: dienelactone hydrolase family protein [Cyclobacteriaceae bacterium]|nr:dienelactone hydrolase family protein [Cyclobacteriaceae bacterium]